MTIFVRLTAGAFPLLKAVHLKKRLPPEVTDEPSHLLARNRHLYLAFTTGCPTQSRLAGYFLRLHLANRHVGISRSGTGQWRFGQLCRAAPAEFIGRYPF